MKMTRKWHMPNPDTFQIRPIAELAARYARGVVIDPFARGCRIGTITNDLNPEWGCDYTMDAREFLDTMADRGVVADCVLLDPPYSPRQISECYEQVGRACTTEDTQNARLYRECKDRIDRILRPGGTVISCGWNSSGMGKGRGYAIEEIMLVCCGGAHNDYIVTVCRKPVPLLGASTLMEELKR
jgi:hypothetical protein